ncbi:MAG: hypothetical protein ACI9C0_000741 [Alteromonadaceae bacterium]|jgi:hypothetical protein|tara:strand:+ start:4029 stop:4205 length:177 start_codon:yes stop_codon:yes gene_type:complete
MREAIDEIKNEVKAKLLYWNNIQSKKVKIALILFFTALLVLKIFTTVLTLDWLADLFS